MAGHRTHHNPLEQDTLFTTPASFMLDARLTPLERNGWQVPRSSERPCAQRAVSGSRKRPQLPTGLPARCLPARASAIFYRPRKQPSGSGGRPHSGKASAGT